MKIRTLSMLAGIAVPLILTGSASAGFLGVKATSKPNDFGLLVVNVYAMFDRPDPGDGSGDHMVAVAGTPNAPMNIQVIGGTFYNSAFGDDRPPSDAFFPAFPSLEFDTFVTIGLKAAGLPPDFMILTPGFPLGITGSSLAGTTFGWAVIPTAPQGDPFNPDYVAGNGQILIGQFSTADGTHISGTMLVQYVSNGKSGSTMVSFGIPTPGALAMLGVAGLIGTRLAGDGVDTVAGVVVARVSDALQPHQPDDFNRNQQRRHDVRVPRKYSTTWPLLSVIRNAPEAATSHVGVCSASPYGTKTNREWER